MKSPERSKVKIWQRTGGKSCAKKSELHAAKRSWRKPEARR
jgi:hypothetical protein